MFCLLISSSFRCSHTGHVHPGLNPALYEASVRDLCERLSTQSWKMDVTLVASERLPSKLQPIAELSIINIRSGEQVDMLFRATSLRGPNLIYFPLQSVVLCHARQAAMMCRNGVVINFGGKNRRCKCRSVARQRPPTTHGTRVAISQSMATSLH